MWFMIPGLDYILFHEAPGSPIQHFKAVWQHDQKNHLFLQPNSMYIV